MMLLNILDDLIRDPASCIVRIEGNEISDLYPNMVEIGSVLDRQDSAQATLIFETIRLEDGSWNVHDDDRIRPWASISIAATFGDREEAIFDGYIRQVNVEFPEQKGGASVTVTCQDTSILIDREQRTFRWGDEVPLSDGDIVTRILAEAGIDFLEAPGEGFPDLVVNQNETDIKFLKKRAEQNNYDLFFRQGQLYFGPLRLDRSAQATILLYAGTTTNAIRFDLNDDGHKPEAVIYEIASDSGDETQQQTVSSDLVQFGTQAATSQSAGLGEFAWRLSREGLNSDSQVQQRAQAVANMEALRITASGELDGASYGHVLLPGDPVAIDGVGERYGGRWYVTKVEHKFDMSGYRQNFEVARNGYGDDLEVSSNAIAGLL